MKLLETFKHIVNDIAPELCWFTTFNLNIELLEKYVLTAIVGKEPSELKRAEDYEALNLELSKFKIKIWYDYRALDLKQGKRTSIDLYPVQASVVLNSTTQEPIFHPKVIFLKGAHTAYLITGSFNLTIAGWSSNRECIVVKEIKNKENALQVVDFFARLNPALPELKTLEKWANQLSDEKANWKFAHNFNTANILDEIKGKELNIWSPYFSKSTAVLMGDIKKYGFSKINLIPDISPSQKVKIIPTELIKLQQDGDIQIQIDKNINKVKQTLFHAKVWLTENKIAIGSWNCSYRALGIKTAANEKNIEAGIIQPISPKHRTALLQNLKLILGNTISGTDEVDMDNEWKEVLKAFSISCDIIANWDTFQYQLEWDNTDKNFTVALPHEPNKRYPLLAINGLSFLNGFNRMLKNKLFTVYNSQNEVVFVGYLNEAGKQKRPIEGYVSFYDLFESLTINPLGTTTKSRVKYQFDEEDNKGSEKEELPFFAYSGHESYYLMFVAFQKLADTLNENQNIKQKMEELGYRLPGSLINIKSLFKTSFQKVLEEKREDDLLFHYFMAMEINECVQLFNLYSEKPIETISIVQFEQLLKLDRKDLKFIKKAMTIK
ncbi:phospholipase D-like domain-containing protein [Algoriphagus sp.]|uniref:phospholipase D-like domain-containing protein n=1 Tax=Algoriphagus sp. TaxID=1872435 RepID=UPI003918CAE1